MSGASCPVCNRRQDDGLMCHACCVKLEYELGDPVVGVAAMVVELDTTLARQGRGEIDGKGGLANERAGFHAGASIAMGALNNTLTTWARDVSSEGWAPESPRIFVSRYRGSRSLGPFCLRCSHPSCWSMRVTTVRPTSTPLVVQAAQFLLDAMVDIRKHPDASGLHDEIVSSIQNARHAIDRAANRTIIEVGPCPEEDEDGTPCPGQVFAFIPTEDDRPSRMECKADGSHKWTAVQWMRTGKRILDLIEQRKQAKEVA